MGSSLRNLSSRLLHHDTKKEEVDEEELINEFRSRLPPLTLHQLESTNEIQPNNPKQLRSLLTRFLRAEKGNLDKAVARLIKHGNWRSTYLPESGSIPNGVVINQINQHKVYLQPPSTKDGKPLLIIKVSNHQPIHDIHEVENFVIYSLEATSRLSDNSINHDGKAWALFDLNDVKWKNLDHHALRSCFHLLNLAYPERVKRIYMLDSPFIFDSLWRVVKPFVDPVTRQKVCFIYGEEGRKYMMKDVDADIVPVEYGGRAVSMRVEKTVEGIVPNVEKLLGNSSSSMNGNHRNNHDTNGDDEEEEFFDCYPDSC